MRVLFAIRFPIDQDYHLNTKYLGIVNAMRECGHDVDILAQRKSDFLLITENGMRKLTLRYDLFAKKLGSVGFYYRLFRYACEVLRNGAYDVVYIRTPAIWFRVPEIARIARDKGVKIVVEIPTHPIIEEIKREKRIMRRLVLKASNLYGAVISKYVDLYVVIGENVNGVYNDRPAINISNAIDVNSKPIRTPGIKKDEIHMLALAAMRYWQGFDRVIEGMSRYEGNYEVWLHLVGEDYDGSLFKLIEASDVYNIRDAVVVHGALYGSDLDALFNLCDVGIGTLGLHRKGMKTGSVLKIRDYMSRGLPFIYAAEDTSLSSDTVGCLQVESSDAPIDIDAVISFVLVCREDEECILKMRHYAEEHMTWRSQVEKIFDALNTQP